MILLECKTTLNITLGIIHNNLSWMLAEATKLGDTDAVFNGILLMDEMSIQQDLQMVKKGKEWSLTGAVDLGKLVNDLEAIKKKRNSNGQSLLPIHLCRIQWL